MHIPVEALEWTSWDEVKAGNLWLSKGHWWLIVEAIRGDQPIPFRYELLLTGERAGAMK